MSAHNLLVEDWRWELQTCCKCGGTLYQGDGFIGNDGWLCRDCGLKERNWRWGDAVETFEKWSKGGKL